MEVKTKGNEPKIIRYSNFSKNLLGIAYPKLKVLSTKKDDNGQTLYYIYLGSTNLSGWYTSIQAKAKFGIDL